MQTNDLNPNERAAQGNGGHRRPLLRFTALLLAVLLPGVIALFPLLLVPDLYGETFLGALSDKFERLNETDDPKIVVIGGSSVAFGLDSEMLSEYTGREVVNFGLYATLGTKVMLDLSRANINKGDIVILAPETDAQTLSLYFNGEATWQALESDLSMLRYIGSDNYGALLASLPAYLSATLSRAFSGQGAISPDGIYRRDSFNEYGDIVYPREYNVMAAGYDINQTVSFTPDLFDAEFVDYLNGYIAWAESKGASVYYSFCPVNESAVAEGNDEETLAAFYRYVAEHLHCDVISDPTALIMEENYFYDTNFHLNDAGVTVRTARLIEDLYRAEGRTKRIGIELPEAPERPASMEEDLWEENEWSSLFLYEEFGDGLKIVGVADEAKGLTVLEIPYKANGKTVRVLGANALAECTALTDLTLYENLTILETGAFDGASGLTRIHIRRTDAEGLEAAAELFDNASSGIRLYFYSDESYQNFVTGYWWSIHAGRMVSVSE